MSHADQRSDTDQDTKYYLIFLHSIPERPLTAEAVDQHAAHWRSSTAAANSLWPGRSWNRRAD